MPCNQPFRDDSAQLLLFKIAECLAAGGGGGGTAGVLSFNSRTGVVTLTSGDVTGALGFTPAASGSGVTSFNTRTGAVTLTSADVTTALGFTPLSTVTGDARYVLKTGDTMTGKLQFSGTTHVGLRLNNLTTGQRDAIAAPTAGDLIWNTTTTQVDRYDGATWGATGTGLYVLKAGDTMTGALAIGNGVLVASTPYLNLSQTWNNGAVTFTGLQSNVTNTASNTNSNLFNFQVDGVDRFNFTPGGSLRAVRQDATDSGMNLFLRKRGNAGGATNALASDATIGTVAYSGWNGAAFVTGSRISGLASEVWTGIANGSRIDLYTTPIGSVTEQIALRLDSTGQAKLLDGTAALPALTFQSDPDTGIYRIGANSLGFSTAGALALTVDATGVTLPAAGAITWTSRGTISRPADGVQLLRDTAGTSFGRLQFGGTTSSFPSIKRVSATLAFRLADDSADAAVTGAGSTWSGNLIFSSDNSFDIGAGGGVNRPRTGYFGSSVDAAGGSVILNSTGLTMQANRRISISSGTNQRAGDAVLVAGTVTVANTTVTANTRVYLTRKVSGGTIGFAVTYTLIAATSFTITSDNALDTSTYSYLLIEVP